MFAKQDIVAHDGVVDEASAGVVAAELIMELCAFVFEGIADEWYGFAVGEDDFIGCESFEQAGDLLWLPDVILIGNADEMASGKGHGLLEVFIVAQVLFVSVQLNVWVALFPGLQFSPGVVCRGVV